MRFSLLLKSLANRALRPRGQKHGAPQAPDSRPTGPASEGFWGPAEARVPGSGRRYSVSLSFGAFEAPVSNDVLSGLTRSSFVDHLCYRKTVILWPLFFHSLS